MLKKLIALLLALLMMATLAACKDPEGPTPDTPSDPSNDLEDPAPTLVKSGEIANCMLTWELYKDGTLYIKGTGEMAEFEANSSTSTRTPWQEYIANENSTTVKKLVVEDGVTSLAEGAFQGCVNLETVQITSDVTLLPYKCFSACRVLRTVRAKGVTQIHSDAFSSCARLASVTFSAALQLVEDGAFYAAGTQSTSFAVRLAGDAEEWAAAQATEAFSIGVGNDIFTAALEKVEFASK